MAIWRDYTDLYPGHTVSGTIKVCPAIYSPQLDNRRDVLVYLPPSYRRGERRYPVLYMHDAQNLFDPATGFAGEWQVDETLETLSAEGIETIVAAIPNLDAEFPGSRFDELSPVPNAAYGRGGKGEQYLAFLRDTVKPLVDTDFRTLPDRDHTGIMGSSLGGLISLYAFFHYPAVFGWAGVMSPAFWFTGGTIYQDVQAAAFVPGRIYMDIGTAEMKLIPAENERKGITSDRYLDDARRMHALLIDRGYRPGEHYLYVEEAGAVHNESAWARRLPTALRFLLA